MGNDSIDFSLSNIWHKWQRFKIGKFKSKELQIFEFNLENELYSLHKDLNSGFYLHGSYRSFTVTDNKRREISVASVRDRVVHRIVYDYLTTVYDPDFDFDVWSCRKNKGLLGAILRSQKLMLNYSKEWVWRSDIKKFFNSVDHDILYQIITRKIRDIRTLNIIKIIIESYHYGEKNSNIGIPIGNLTSQIFANIYLNDFDKFIRQSIKPLAFLRYGDDFLVFASTINDSQNFQAKTESYLENNLRLALHQNNNYILKTKQGLKYLGMEIFANGRRLNKRNKNQIIRKMNVHNYPSYWGIIQKHGKIKDKKIFDWRVLELISRS